MDTKNEKLFWSIYRNVFLREEIFKNIKSKFRLGRYSYYECNDANFMIKNGYFNLLKDKVSRNDRNLVINDEIFSYFKNKSLFFFDLFKNYPDLITKVDKIIQGFGITAFKVLVQDYNYVPTELNLIEAIKCGSFEIAKFIIYNPTNSFEITNEIKENIWKKSIGYVATIELKTNYRLINVEMHVDKCNFFIQHFINEQYPTLPEPIEIEKKYQTPDTHKLFYSNGKSVNNRYYSDIKCLFKMFIYDKPLGFVLDSCKLLSNILKLQKEPHQERPEFILTLDELNGMKFTSQQLNSPIGEADPSNIEIKKLFIMLLYFTNDFPMAENYTFMGMKYYSQLDKFAKIFNPMDFGTYDGECAYKRPIQTAPFKYCKNRDVIIQYIQRAIDDIADPTIEVTSKFSINKLFDACFLFDDLEILEMVYNSLSSKLGDTLSFSMDTLTNVQSISIFDFIFSKLKTEEAKIESFKYIIKNYELANHFKVNYPDYYYSSVYSFSVINCSTTIYEKSQRFIYENWSDFREDQFDVNDHLPNLISHFTIVNPKEIHQLNKIKIITKPYYPRSIGSESTVVQLNYIIDNRMEEFQNGIAVYSTSTLMLVAYLRNQLKEYLENGIIKIKRERSHDIDHSFFDLNRELNFRNDTKTLQYLLDYYSNDKEVFEFLNSSFQLSKLLKKLNNNK